MKDTAETLTAFDFLGENIADALPEPPVFDVPLKKRGNGRPPHEAEKREPVQLEPETLATFAESRQRRLDYDNLKRYLSRSDTGDAELLARLYQGRIVYDHSMKPGTGWHFWTGHNWQHDHCGYVRSLVSDNVAEQYFRGATLARKRNDDERAKAFSARGYSLRQSRQKSITLREARHLPELALVGDEWNANPWLLGCPGGAIDLRTGELKAGDPKDYIRDVVNVEWEGLDAKAPRWERFLREIFAGDQEMVAFIQRLLGYGIAGLSVLHKLPVLWGEGRNGKDTFLETIKYVLGPLASPVPNEVLLSGTRAPNQASPHLHAMLTLRLTWSSETEEGARLAAGQVKLLTGGGSITARPLYGNPVTFNPQYLFFLVTNHKPHANADDYALWQRLLLIEFNEKFVEDPRGPHEHEADPYLAQKLRDEAGGILAWLVRGCLDWQQRGLDVPLAVTKATQEYQDEEDVMSVFFEDRCVLKASARTKASEFYKAYRDWCEDRGSKAMSQTTFGRRMDRRFKKIRLSDGRYYEGVGILATEEYP